MADAQKGMSKGEMKRLLRISQQDPVSCAVGLSKDGSAGLMVLDKLKQPRALEKVLLGDEPDAKNIRWGTASVDPENTKLVRLTLNRAASGLARKLIKTLKGTGVSKVQIGLDDGTVLESHEEAEEEQDADEPGAGSEPAQEQEQAAAQPDAPSREGLTAQLEALVKRIRDAEESVQGKLTAFARAAGVAIKSGDLAEAAKALEGADSLTNGPAPQAAAPPQQPDPSAGAAVRVAKGLLVWNGTRGYVEQQIRKLEDAIITQSEAERDFDAIRANVGKINVIMERLDDSLSEKLDALRGSQDPAEKNRITEEARKIIAAYQSYVATDELIADIDDNGFVPLDVKARLTAALDAVQKIV
jgi:hypothetical protein